MTKIPHTSLILLSLLLSAACSGEDGPDSDTPGTLPGGDGDSTTAATGGGSATGGDGDVGGDGDNTGPATGGGSGGSSSGGGTDIPSGTFLADDDGYVVFEAEAIAGENPPAPWVYGTAEHCVEVDNMMQCSAPLDGGGYYKFGGASECSQTNDKDVGLMTLNFQIKESGLYRMAWRNMRDHTGGCAHDLNNDSFVTFPTAKDEPGHTEPFKVFGGGDDSFTWSGNQDAQNSPAGSFEGTNKKPVCVMFDAGIHEMRLSGRSNNHTIDRIAFVPVEGTLEDCHKGAVVRDLDTRPLTEQAP